MMNWTDQEWCPYVPLLTEISSFRGWEIHPRKTRILVYFLETFELKSRTFLRNSTHKKLLLGEWFKVIHGYFEKKWTKVVHSHIFFSFHFLLFADFSRSHLDANNEEVQERDLNAPPIKSLEYKVFNFTSFRDEYARAINDITTKVEQYLYGASGIEI